MNRPQADIRISKANSPLSAFPLFRSHDLDEIRSQVAKVFKPHHLRIEGQQQRPDTRMDHAPIGANTSLNRLRYGADVLIEPDRLEDFLLVQMPLRGGAHIRCGNDTIDSHTSLASVLTPSLPLTMQWRGACDQLIVRISRSALESMCGAQLGHALPRPLEFSLGMDLSRPTGQGWKRLIDTLAHTLALHDGKLPPLVAAQFDQLLVASLLSSQPHNYSLCLNADTRPAAPAHVQQAEAYLQAHCAQPVTIEDLVAHTQVSARSLYKGFQQYRGISPMAYLKLVRLQCVRERLLQARDAGETVAVTQVAMDYGFTHLGHFSQAYRQRFHETPGQTLSH